MQHRRNIQKNENEKRDIYHLISFLTFSIIFLGFGVMAVSANIQYTTSNVSTASWDSDQEFPSVWQDRIVWQDRMDWIYEIVYYNSTTGDERPITTGISDHIQPKIFENIIVYAKWDDWNYNIEFYDLDADETTRITNKTYDQLHPSVWGDIIAWEDHKEGSQAISYNDRKTGEEHQASEYGAFASKPDVWGNYIVWEQWFEDNSEIMLFNISNTSVHRITFDSENQQDPSIWEDRIVWSEYRDGFNQISLFNITTGIKINITSDPWNHDFPVIFNDSIVYENEKDYYDITLFNITSGEELLITPDTLYTAQTNPAVWDTRIVWEDDSDQYFDIYLCTLGVSLPQMNADFTTNITEGMLPLTVQFSDTSTGEVTGWWWDFGDGTDSHEQNPVYTYTETGIYPVILTVNNPYQRSAVKKEGIITVGALPSPEFSAEILSGPAPLSIQFRDASTGSPTAWLWAFGDGNVSYDQNPVYTYSTPGIYSVSLTAENAWGNGTIEKEDYITVVGGISHVSIFPSEGIGLEYNDNGIYVILNTPSFDTTLFNPLVNASVITVIPESGSGLSGLDLLSSEDEGFSQTGNDTIEGNLTGVRIRSQDCQSANRNSSEGLVWDYNYSAFFPEYPMEGIVTSTLWEESTPEDSTLFENIAMNNDHHVNQTAFTLVFMTENIGTSGPATIIFGIDSDWIEQNGWRWSHDIFSEPSGAVVNVDSKFAGYTPLTIGEGLSPGNHTVSLFKNGFYPNTTIITLDDKRENIQVIRIGDSGLESFINTTFLFHNPATNMDYFMAYSPEGLSKFGITSVWQEGNIFQLIQMAASKAVGPSGGGGGGGDDYAGSITSTSSTTTSPTAAPTGTAVPQSTSSPSNEQVPATVLETQVPAEIPLEVTSAPGETEGLSAPEPPGLSPFGPSSIIFLKNLSIVFVVIFVTMLFYLRWKRKEE
jgi:beta propeller repeat protein